MDAADLAGLVGRPFPGGVRTVEHWENWLLTDCTRRPPMPDGLLHPVALFHVPIQAAGTSIGDLFAMAGNDGAPGSVSLQGYDWEYLTPLHEGIAYSGSGSIVSAERTCTPDGAAWFDDVAFSIELRAGGLGDPVARVTNRWRFRRAGSTPPPPPPDPATGTSLPTWEVLDVGTDRMKTMAALLRDPYPIHWDPEAARAAGHGDRPINQGPLNLSYIANLLMAWAGDTSIRRLTVRFHGRVLAGDTVVAGGTVDRVLDGIAHCSVWLDRDGRRLVSGTAQVMAPTGLAQ